MVMRLTIVLALGALGATPPQGDHGNTPADRLIQHLDLASFASRGIHDVADKHTFADLGFEVISKTAYSARLFRKSDALTKSFEIMIRDGQHLQVCFHDTWVLMPKSPEPLRFDYREALAVEATGHGLWKAWSEGSFPGCISNPPLAFNRPLPPPPPSPPSGLGALIEAVFARHRSSTN